MGGGDGVRWCQVGEMNFELHIQLGAYERAELNLVLTPDILASPHRNQENALRGRNLDVFPFNFPLHSFSPPLSLSICLNIVS